MITEDYVSFETANLLREKGFKEATLAYAYGQDMIGYYSQPRVTDDYKVEAGRYPLPTLQMASKWLREVHKIHISICMGADVDNPAYIFYNPQISTFNRYGKDKNITYLGVFDEEEFVVYEVALEAAIKYCLENLI